jgi:transposase
MAHRTPQEKMLIVRTHRYFLTEAQQRLDPLGRAVHERVAKSLAVSESLVARVVAAWNQHGEDAFAVPPAKRGRPPRSEVEDYRDYITEIINDRNLSQKPTASRIICAGLQTLTGVAIPEQTMRDELQKMDVSYIRGRKRDPRADSKVNVAFRNSYLQKKVSNLTARSYPKKEEIYLDESYCKVNHVAEATWVVKNSPRYCASGAGQRYCTVSAGAVLVKNGRLHAEWVPGSVKTWPSHLKGDDSDYHGNFNGPLFERWFEDLCIGLLARYGPCRIHMDGAAYHKVIEDRAPTKSTSKSTMIDWLHKHGVTVSADKYSKKQLERLIAQVRVSIAYNIYYLKANCCRNVLKAKPPTTYRAVTKAQQYNQEVLHTSPYHPELQPIEMIWGALKNRIALDPASSVADLGKKIEAGLKAITKREWIGAYQKIRKQEVAYLPARNDSNSVRRRAANTRQRVRGRHQHQY